jgi:hypothetical protein
MNITIRQLTREEFVRQARASKPEMSDADFAAKVAEIKAERHITGEPVEINRPQFGPGKRPTFRIIPQLRQV